MRGTLTLQVVLVLLGLLQWTHAVSHGDVEVVPTSGDKKAFGIFKSPIRKVIRKRKKIVKDSIDEEGDENDDVAMKRRIVLRKRVKVPNRPHLESVDKDESIANPESSLVSPPLVNQDSRRDGRFFSLFTVVRFTNDACPTSNGLNGTCYTSIECKNRGGVSEGSCASGFGVCCFFQYQCGSSTAENGTYFVSPSTPQRICNLMVKRLNDDICQIRLDLETFDLSGPNELGECITDFFLVTGGSQVPQICGINSGQHLIYSITPNSGPSQLSVVTDTSVSATVSRQWKIRITQLECSSRMLAPVGCLQYFTSASGLIQSFNYKSETTNDNTNQLANMNYAICVRVENGYCGIKYAQDVSDMFSFTITENSNPSMTAAMLMSGIKVGDAQCSKDYLIITSGSQDGGTEANTAKERYCGTSLGRCFRSSPTSTMCTPAAGPVTTYSRPFAVHVITDRDETGDTANRGFKLTFNQQPCLSVVG